MPEKSDRSSWTDQLANSDWGLSADAVAGLDDNTLEFMSYELAGEGRTRAAYLERVDYHGLTGADRVLDFGCGVGQWCVALAERNGEIFGVDKTTPRIQAARMLGVARGSKNIRFEESLEGFPDLSPGSVDLILCYSVFMFLEGAEMASRFHQLLRPGGRLYMMVDLPAWHLRALSRRPQALPFVGYMALRTLLGLQRNIVYTKASLRRLLTQSGFEIQSDGADGEASFLPVDARPSRSYAPFLPNRFLGLQTLYEVCAIKR